MVVCFFPKEVALGALLLVVLLLIKGIHTFPLIPEELWGVSGVGRLRGGGLCSTVQVIMMRHMKERLALQPFGGKFCPPAYLVAEFHVSILNNNTYLETIA